MSETYTLKHPCTTRFRDTRGEERSETITEVTMRRATGKDLKLIDRFRDKPIELTLNMISRLSGLEVHQVEQFDAEDIGPLGDLAMASSPNGQQTGGIA